jgi:hypothetical protein
MIRSLRVTKNILPFPRAAYLYSPWEVARFDEVIEKSKPGASQGHKSVVPYISVRVYDASLKG